MHDAQGALERERRRGRHGDAGAVGNRSACAVCGQALFGKTLELLHERRERGVVGHGKERLVRGFARKRSQRGRDSVDDRRIDARVLEAHLHVVRARAAGKGHETRRVGKALEVDVVDPRDIVAVGIVVVEEERAEASARGLDGLDLPIKAHRILGEIRDHLAPGYMPALHAPAGGHIGVERGLEAARVGAHLRGGKESGRHVVDHIEAVVFGGKPCGLNARGDVIAGNKVECIPAAAELYVRGTAGELRARPAAGGAAVGAELPVLHVCVVERCVALGAKARIGDAVGLGARFAVDAEGNAAVGHAVGDRGAERVVCVEDEHGRG